jgi:hypothetical protein
LTLKRIDALEKDGKKNDLKIGKEERKSLEKCGWAGKLFVKNKGRRGQI